MANFAASATQFAGQALVRTASAIAINTATSYISRAFDTHNFEGPRLDSFHLQTSREGAPMPRVFGRARLAGQVIWASHVRETASEETVGGKGGGPTQTNYSYRISFAVGLCEGEISGVDRIWANGAPLETRGLDFRVHTGREDQRPDPIIAAIEGADAPAFRGTAYAVFEDFPLDDYGNRLPQLNFEIVRAGAKAGQLETLVQSVNMLPGSGEFAYATQIIEESPRPGVTRPLNMNNVSARADIEVALDQLQAQLPNCRNVSIISSWFASSLDIATCEIRPGVERDIRNIRNSTWQVGRDDRGSAYVVSSDTDGRPNFGGTPSDESLIQAIRAIRARGMTVTLYPFVLVDTPGFPWRGRMTGAAASVGAFFGDAAPADFSIGAGENHYRATDNRFRNFVLSHANLARRAGGVDRFVIGTEMRGLTTIRDSANRFPAVTELARLAGDVRTLLGAGTELTYAADWSEYFGFHPQDESGDVFFHLDELWAHPAINAIGIDAYFPLSDWREGEHLDAQLYDNPYDPAYLASNIEGGEGYEWYYASDTDRQSQTRAKITDWVYRYKDIRSWWANPHRNRIDGIEQAPTAWVPESKPIWLTEVGCPAVRFGSNQPNLFSDGKSIESNIPYFSDGSRDDLIQRCYLEALIGYWAEPGNNPISVVTGERMVTTSATSVWAWDARPFPDFPARTDVWSDGLNWQTGHWINGRVGTLALGDLITDICAEMGLETVDVSGVTGLVSGFVIDRPMRARDALAPLFDAYDLTLSEHAGEVRVFNALGQVPQVISLEDLVDVEAGPIRYSLEEEDNSLRDARLTFSDASRDYQTASVSARNEQAETVRVQDMSAPLVLDPEQARQIVQRTLAKSEPARRTAQISLPPHHGYELAPGALLELPETEGVWQVDRLRHGLQTDIDLVQVPPGNSAALITGIDPLTPQDPPWTSEPVALAFDLPHLPGLQTGVLLDPFRPAQLSQTEGEAVSVDRALGLGALLTPLPRGATTLWDRRHEIEIWMPGRALSAQSEAATLSGGNRFAVETEAGWEILAAADITLIGPQTYRLKTLLRGLGGSDDLMMAEVAAGARVLVLDAAVTSLPLDPDFIGAEISVSVEAGGRTGVAAEEVYEGANLRPLSVAHVETEALPDSTRLSWTPRYREARETPDPADQFLLEWEGGSMTVTGHQAEIPVTEADVSITPVDPIGGRGRPVSIRV